MISGIRIRVYCIGNVLFMFEYRVIMAPRKTKIPKNAPKGLWAYMLEQNKKGKKLPSTVQGVLREYEGHKLEKKLKKS